MAGVGTGAEQTPLAVGGPGEAGPGAPRAGPDWAGLPEHLLMKVATKFVAQTEAGWAAHLKGRDWDEEAIQDHMAERKREGNCCLFVFALVCKGWRKAQLKVGGPLRTRVKSDVLLPGRLSWRSGRWRRGAPGRMRMSLNSMAPWLAPLPATDTSSWSSGCAGRGSP